MSVGWKRTDSGGYECFLEYGECPRCHLKLLKKSNNMGCVEYAATFGSIILLILTLPFSLFWCFKVRIFICYKKQTQFFQVVQEYERAVIFRLGRLRTGGARGPGIFFILPCVDSYCKVDLRTVSFDVPPQEALTKDSVTVTVDAVVYYRIQDPLNAVTKVTNYSNSTRLLAMTTLRNILGTRNLAEVLSDREAISHAMQTSLDVATDPWGVKVERVEIKDVSLPQQLQRAMAAEAEASREARAKVIAAEGEMKASRALKEAADVISEAPGALQLRYLQTLNNISAEKNSTIIFPLPIDMISYFVNYNNGSQVI
ncbi:band 7 protein AGAP004871-like isoform X4 [Tenebrio molitor]|uniref:band 7 protein AGAP004871-like isoform X4 n=1 Tax=Tenebrio molitor TaxID=7067 RepID=UPI003624A967